MIIKNRSESDELKFLRSLNAMTVLEKKDKDSYLSAEKGYEGEVQFDEWTKPLVNDMVVLNDLLLEHQGSEFQIDSFAVASKTIFHFEVKNFEGDFIIDDGEWRSPIGKGIKNPLIQVSRAASLIKQITEQSGFRYPIESYLIFVNPQFHLDNPPAKTASIVYPTQISRFFKNSKTEIYERVRQISGSRRSYCRSIKSRRIFPVCRSIGLRICGRGFCVRGV
ncbi:nuclease-related domain-containing protein [Bacillus sp. SG-1]|uniref:nuclease-related domain-containing protein n=1 Tax=Bacillus sp. SG-1 TaxID=161544 RepID=UPI0001543632|nr:nuclease-related domain-containing protein [Bacillus sp. SG-1]EDL66329.1 hypothetical protein BSG1_03215 [Bacillus sp. SG-1]